MREHSRERFDVERAALLASSPGRAA